MLFFNEEVEETVGNWNNFLADVDIDFALKLNNRVKGLRDTVTIYPEQDKIFKVFKDIDPLSVKVVVLGQDPYHNGNATGAAFACKKSLSPSLKQIWSSIKKDTKKEYEGKVDPSLEHLIEQGVFLLNTILTVQEGKPLSHKYMQWERFTSSVIHRLSKKRNNLVFMLWGANAQKFKKYIDRSKHLVLMDVHPQYANYQGREWNCTHFSECNKYLNDNSIKPIMWR